MERLCRFEDIVANGGGRTSIPSFIVKDTFLYAKNSDRQLSTAFSQRRYFILLSLITIAFQFNEKSHTVPRIVG